MISKREPHVQLQFIRRSSSTRRKAFSNFVYRNKKKSHNENYKWLVLHEFKFVHEDISAMGDTQGD